MNGSDWTPARALELSGGYWSTCALHAGLKLGLFTCLRDLSAGPAELAGKLRSDERSLAMLLRALAALGLLEIQGGRYINSSFARAHLVKDAPGYLGHIMLHHHYLMESWAHLDQAVRSGHPLRHDVVEDEEAAARRESFLLGMFNLAMSLAPQLVPLLDLGGRRRLLDLGGGPGTYALHFCRHNPELSAVVFDLPTTRPFFEQTAARFGLGGRVTFQAGDYQADPVVGRFDVAWLSHILHGEGPDGCRIIIDKAVAALEPGGLLIIQEFILDDDGTGPIFPALFSLNMLLATEHGQSYSEGELRAMLTVAGVREVRRIRHGLPGHTSLLVGSV